MDFEQLLNANSETDPTSVEGIAELLAKKMQKKKTPREYSVGEGIFDVMMGGMAGAAEGLKGTDKGQEAAARVIGAKEAMIEKRRKALDAEESPQDLKLLTQIAALKQKGSISEQERKLREDKLRQEMEMKGLGLNLKEQQIANKLLEQQLKGQEKEQDKTQKEVEKFKKSTEDLYTLGASLENIENEIAQSVNVPGFKLEKYNPSTGTVDGQPVDLPGVSIPGAGRVSFYSGPSRSLESTIASMENQLLKARSGAAVTESEFARMKNELSRARSSSEEEMVKALARFKADFTSALKRNEQTFPKGAQELKARGFRLSEDYSSQPSQPSAASDDARAARLQELRQKYGR